MTAMEETPDIRLGDTWTIVLHGKRRLARVVGLGPTAGSWQCVDEETGTSFSAARQSFVDRIPDADDLADA